MSRTERFGELTVTSTEVQCNFPRLGSYLLFSIRFAKSIYLLSFRELFNETTAQIAAGSHPINVICNKAHKIAKRTFPRSKNDSHGNNTLIRIISSQLRKQVTSLAWELYFVLRRIENPSQRGECAHLQKHNSTIQHLIVEAV